VCVRSVLQTGQLTGHVIVRPLRMNAFPGSAKPLYVGSTPTRASNHLTDSMDITFRS
jgi:hypothetical protein